MDFHDSAVRNVQARLVQADELLATCYAKEKNVPYALAAPEEAGNIWNWIAVDCDSKLVISYYVSGTRGVEHSERFMQDLQSRLANRVQLTTDGMLTYPEAVERAFGRDIDYAQLIKRFNADGKVEFVRKDIITGNPDLALAETSFVERQNLTIRMSVRRFTRLTNAFSKNVVNHRRALAIYATFFNFIRPHMSLGGRTPAQAVGLTEYAMSFNTICDLIDERMPPLAPRGPYRTRRKIPEPASSTNGHHAHNSSTNGIRPRQLTIR